MKTKNKICEKKSVKSSPEKRLSKHSRPKLPKAKYFCHLLTALLDLCKNIIVPDVKQMKYVFSPI